MTTAIQFRRGTTDEHLLFTGLEGEITVDTTKSTAVVHDNKTAGGFALAREDLKNIPMQKIVDKGIAKSDMTNVSCDDIASRQIAKQDLSNVSKDDIASRGIMKSDSSNATQLATETTIGPTQFATIDETLLATNNAKAGSPKNALTLINKHIKLPPNYVDGLIVSKNANNIIQISKGCARSNDDKYDIIFNTDITKNINTMWEVGNGLGGLKSGLTLATGTTYFIFAILTNNNIADIIISNEELSISEDIIAIRKIGAFSLDENLYIDEASIVDSHDKNLPNQATTITLSFANITSYKIPFDGNAFFVVGTKDTAAVNLYLNKQLFAFFKNDNNQWIYSSTSIPVKKNDVITNDGANDINRKIALYLFKERKIENV